eukprot:GHVS01101070.1.p1 GENE.GHVS01101070.1~~GHVS01101070.1.p1  ORF type:complete len:222 (-),score=1.37 GHVS01101070.1:26-691(-)
MHIRSIDRLAQDCFHEITVKGSFIRSIQGAEGTVSGVWQILGGSTYVLYTQNGGDMRDITRSGGGNDNDVDFKVQRSTKSIVLLVPRTNQYMDSELMWRREPSSEDLVYVDYFDCDHIISATTSSSVDDNDDDQSIYTATIDVSIDAKNQILRVMFVATFGKKTRTFIAKLGLPAGTWYVSMDILPCYCTNHPFAVTSTTNVPFTRSDQTRFMYIACLCPP